MPPRAHSARRPRARLALLVVVLALLGAVAVAPSAGAASVPLHTWFPEPQQPSLANPSPPQLPPPDSYLDGPCGVAVDSGGRFYVADYYHDAVDVFSEPSRAGYLTQLRLPATESPCALAVDPAGDLYVAAYHGAVRRWQPAVYPPEAGPHQPAKDPPEMGTEYTAAGTIDTGRATGLAVDGAGQVYVAHRDRVSVYDSAGVLQREIGEGELGEAWGVAVSGFPGTAGDVYVADAASGTVKVFDPGGAPLAPIGGPPGGFASLREASVAVDDESGEVYVLEDTQPTLTEEPRGRVDVFSAAGAYEGHLLFDVLDGAPGGLAVDNSGGAGQGRVYVTTGNTHFGGLYVYPPAAATTEAPLPPKIPPAPPIGGLPVAPIEIGGPASSGTEIPCEGDSCRSLPPEPVDPTLTTLLEGPGSPPVHYRTDKPRRRHKRHRKHHRKHHGGRHPRGDHGRPGGRRRAAASVALVGAAAAPAARPVAEEPGEAAGAPAGAAAPATITTDAGLLPGSTGFGAAVRADGGAAATLAGSHPYQLALHVGLDESGGAGSLRDLRLDFPAGLFANPGAQALCGPAEFATPRSSPFEASGSGESCPDASQVGTIEVTTTAGQTRRFGLFNLAPAAGTAARLGAAPFGVPLVFDGTIGAGGNTPFGLSLQASEIPQALAIADLDLVLWGTPWAASHNTERGNCLNESEPGFAWARCSVGARTAMPPLAFLTLPTDCGSPLAFAAGTRTWQDAGEASAGAVSLDAGGGPALLQGCSALTFKPGLKAFLTTKKASSPSGFGFQLAGTDAGLLDPAGRVSPPPRSIVVHLPDGVTLNPSVGAGLGVCTPAQLAAETPFNKAGAGCPNDSKLGSYQLEVPFYQGLLEGSIYLAQPDNPLTTEPGAENPFDSLIAVYLVSKSAQRGILIKVPGQITADPRTGDLLATFDGLPELPYGNVEMDFHAGQRSFLVSPPACGPAVTESRVTPYTGTASLPAAVGEVTTWQIESGVDGGPCPSGSTRPFHPGAIAGGVNSNVGSYTPYFIHLSRTDTEAEITSYSLVLPRGITGKLAGIPFCPDAAIEAARTMPGFEETAHPSCPAASQVGRTETGYGVGAALTYAPGRIYLAGPYHGAPLSLVTIDAATVGPFDLGTIVVRSAFDIDPHTAQLRIDSAASDPIPHILGGVVLHLRDIRIYMDRPQFTHNPTSCEPSQLESTLTGSGPPFTDPHETTAGVDSRFQLLDCRELPFRPKLGLRLRGGVARGAFPSLRATFAARPGNADLKRIAVAMPHAEFLAQGHIRAICTQPEFAAGRCPPGSVYGRAVAYTPLLDAPLRGDVYLRSSTHKLPDLVADLHSGSIRIILEGRIGPSRKGGILAYFDGLPDAPIDRFTMILRGGRHGLLTNSVNICRHPPTARVEALGQNDAGAIFGSVLRGQCKKQKKKKKKPRRGRGHGGGKGGARRHGGRGAGR